MIDSTSLPIHERVGTVLLSLILALYLLLLSGTRAHAAIDLFYPPPNSWTSRADHLVFKMNNLDYSGVKVTINGVESDILPVDTPEYRRAFQDFVILQPLWDQGKNSIVIEAYAAGKPADKLQADIFFSAERNGAGIPAEYTPAIMHKPENEVQCVACHTMKPTLAQVNTTTGKSNPCYSCHKKIIDVAFVHGPAGTFSCAYCHALQSSPKYATPKREVALCGECHVETMKKIKAWKLRHGPVDAGMCEICHDSHGSATFGHLKMPVNTLCLSCHEKISQEPHVNPSAFAGSAAGHPLSGKPDIGPKGNGREISCVSCHEPHGGDYRYYFQNNKEGRMTLCQYCHKK